MNIRNRGPRDMPHETDTSAGARVLAPSTDWMPIRVASPLGTCGSTLQAPAPVQRDDKPKPAD